MCACRRATGVIVQIAEPGRGGSCRRSATAGPCRLAARPAVVFPTAQSIAEPSAEESTMTHDRTIPHRDSSCSAAPPALGRRRPACRAARRRRPKGASSSAPGAATMRACSPRTSSTPLLGPRGWEVVQDQAGDPRSAAPRCWPRSALPRGTTDMQGLSAANMFEMNEAGVDRADRLREAARTPTNLLPAMKYPYGVGHIYSGKVGVYNPEAHRDRAQRASRTSLDPKHGNKLGIIDIQYQYTMVCGGAGRRRQGRRLRARQEAAARVQEGRRAHLSRPTRRSRRRSRPRRSASASCGRRAPCSGRTPASTSRPSRRTKACRSTSRASSSRRTRRTRTAPTPTSTRCWRRARRRPSPSTWATTRPSPTRRSRPISRSASASPREEQKRWSISTTATSTKNDAALKEWWDKEFKG